MSQTSSIDHARFAKLGFLVGLAMFLVGAGGEIVGQSLLHGLPEWEARLLFDVEVIGLLVGFFSPIVFGVVLPLIE